MADHHQGTEVELVGESLAFGLIKDPLVVVIPGVEMEMTVERKWRGRGRGMRRDIKRGMMSSGKKQNNGKRRT